MINYIVYKYIILFNSNIITGKITFLKKKKYIIDKNTQINN
jgi:hypothetical protein